MSLVNQQVQLWNLAPLLRSASIEGFMKGTILFQWPWRCTAHLGVIWIVSSRSVLIFFMIDDRKVIYPCLFRFNFLGNVLVLFFNVLLSLLQRGRLHGWEMFVLDFLLLLDLTICMQATLDGLWVKQFPTTRRTSFHLSSVPMGCMSFGLPFCLPCDGFGHQFFIRYFVNFAFSIL